MYRAEWVDGSVELLEASDMKDARIKAKKLYDGSKLLNVKVVMADAVETADDDLDEPETNSSEDDEGDDE